jgi:sulfate adenylyltransferase (ADP) / ATP adenylyltransferase
MTRSSSPSLWQQIVERSQSALASGALQSIPTHYEWVSDGDVQFLVRIVDNIRRKGEARKAQADRGPDFNPFLPYETDLFIADLSPTHVAILNKFNVVDHHLLIITRHFESQETLLTRSDFEALWVAMAEIDGLAFYNGGRLAGASQPHKHLQLVPLPFLANDPTPHARLPIEPTLLAALPAAGVGQSAALPFQHAIVRLDLLAGNAVDQLQSAYHAALQACGITIGDGEIASPASGAYNLLITRDWLFLIPRSQDGVGRIGINSLGFAGALLVKNAEQMALLKAQQPLHLLAQVGLANV